MTLIELVVFLTLICFGIACGIYGNAMSGFWLGLLYGILSIVLAATALQLVANFAYFLHRRKLSRIIHCKCGACRADEYEWSYDNELDRPIVKFKCGRKYSLVKRELREIEMSFEENGDEIEVTGEEQQ